MKRRNFVLTALLASVSQRVFAQLKPTPSQQEGPFYPVVPIPRIDDLVRHDGGSASGERLALGGRVMDRDGNPLPDTLIEIWQCDAFGRYRHPRDGAVDSVDRHFAGFGSVVIPSSGEFSFSTLLPVPYATRPPHIHVKLHLDNREMLTTQLYFKESDGDGLLQNAINWFNGDRDLLLVHPQPIGSGKWQARFDFVVNRAA